VEKRMWIVMTTLRLMMKMWERNRRGGEEEDEGYDSIERVNNL